jgi:hypothetical protein
MSKSRRNREACPHSGLMGMRDRIRHPVWFALVAAACAAPACSRSAPPADSGPTPAVFRNEIRYGLTFEERMTVPPALSRLKAEASRRADEVYDPFRSRENAIRNEEMSQRIYEESRQSFLAEHGLSEPQLDEIIREYQASLGANLR